MKFEVKRDQTLVSMLTFLEIVKIKISNRRDIRVRINKKQLRSTTLFKDHFAK